MNQISLSDDQAVSLMEFVQDHVGNEDGFLITQQDDGSIFVGSAMGAEVIMRDGERVE